MSNIFTNRFWRSLKYEEVYLHDYESPRQARHGLAAYLTFYNQKRLHQSLDYQTPAEVYTAPPPASGLLSIVKEPIYYHKTGLFFNKIPSSGNIL